MAGHAGACKLTTQPCRAGPKTPHRSEQYYTDQQAIEWMNDESNAAPAPSLSPPSPPSPPSPLSSDAVLDSSASAT